MDIDSLCGTPEVGTSIPPGRAVAGLEYGRHINQAGLGRCGYCVRVPGGPWVVAWESPEYGDDDEAIVAAIAEESAAYAEAARA